MKKNKKESVDWEAQQRVKRIEEKKTQGSLNKDDLMDHALRTGDISSLIHLIGGNNEI